MDARIAANVAAGDVLAQMRADVEVPYTHVRGAAMTRLVQRIQELDGVGEVVGPLEPVVPKVCPSGVQPQDDDLCLWHAVLHDVEHLLKSACKVALRNHLRTLRFAQKWSHATQGMKSYTASPRREVLFQNCAACAQSHSNVVISSICFNGAVSAAEDFTRRRQDFSGTNATK